MPFMGRDWRSPGEAWVKTDSLGWQRMKIIESQLHPPCHQNPACSWPPRSEFGQHMANHCSGYTEHGVSYASESGDCYSSTSSSNNSRGGSVSPTPSGSPEKNMHHIYPITISSPYGQYSCCAHHFDSVAPKPSRNNNRETSLDGRKTAQVESPKTPSAQSLSRARVLRNIADNQADSLKMRYNNSLSDFRTQSNLEINDFDPSQIFNKKITHPQQSDTNKAIADENSRSSPTLRDGQEVNELSDMNNIDNGLKQTQQAPGGGCCSCVKLQQQNVTNHNQSSNGEGFAKTAPHCRISVRTREVAMYNTISEAFYRLDFCNAIHDIRRFNYICKLLHLLITQNLTSLSGCATKVLFTMLEQVAWEVSSNKRNIHVLKNLLDELRQMIQKYYCWGRPIGSSLLWQQHFDTIARISQIVDGIELSPPKSDNQVTLNNLPVEMIGEILLRLNDYRDLVNAAQATPIMRSMIDGQYLWQQLCKYHFTEQQLKLALDNNYNRNNLTKRNNTIRGVKYAKTASPDGRTSFRNPVSHKTTCPPPVKPAAVTTTRQQIEQTSGRRNSRQNSTSQTLGLVRTDCQNSEPSSQVTRAIKIFDRDGSSGLPKSSGRDTNSKSSRLPVSSSSSSANVDDKLIAQTSQVSNSSRSSHEIDWERVFHQLRKKFDLKEEYPDCLLLCRHCRCLFWKSFGHPCIKNDDGPKDRQFCSNFQFNQPSHDSTTLAAREVAMVAQSNSLNSSQNCDQISREAATASAADRWGRQEASSSSSAARDAASVGRSHGQMRSRISVAQLSRSFDNRSTASGSNGAPSANPRELARQFSSDNDRRPSAAGGDALAAANRLYSQNNNGNSSNNQSNNNDNNNNINGNPSSRSANMRRDELVPKHVAISPQAFLKFFSL